MTREIFDFHNPSIVHLNLTVQGETEYLFGYFFHINFFFVYFTNDVMRVNKDGLIPQCYCAFTLYKLKFKPIFLEKTLTHYT